MTINKCQHCGCDLLKGDLFCPNCGSDTSSVGQKFCYACGKELKPDSKFCSGCGAPQDLNIINPKPLLTASELTLSSNQQTNNSGQSLAHSSKGSSDVVRGNELLKSLGAVVIAGCLIAAVGTYFYQKQQTPPAETSTSLDVAGLASAGNINTTSFATAVGSCQAVTHTVRSNPTVYGYELRGTAHEMFQHLNAVGDSLKGDQRNVVHQAWSNSMKSIRTTSDPQAVKQDLLWCAKKIDAGQL